MPYAALRRLSDPLAGHTGALPARQQQALQVAADAAEGPGPDRLLVGLGTLGLLADAARIEPLLCVVDDAH
jgi:hypothetical protein